MDWEGEGKGEEDEEVEEEKGRRGDEGRGRRVDQSVVRRRCEYMADGWRVGRGYKVREIGGVEQGDGQQ